MKRISLVLILLLLTASCATKTKSLNGDWRQIFVGFEGEKEGYGIVTDSVIVNLKLDQPYLIQFDYQDDLGLDKADSISYHYPQLVFRKLNYNKSYNRYNLTYDESCDCFNGWFKSFTGNQVKVKWVRN